MNQSFTSSEDEQQSQTSVKIKEEEQKPQSKNDESHKLFTSSKNKETFLCKLCEKEFSTPSNLKQHLNIHQSSLIRDKFTCFIRDCSKSYLYNCTLKKHIQRSHKDEFQAIIGNFEENERNFSEIHKYLEANPNMFPFLKFKKKLNKALQTIKPIKEQSSSCLSQNFQEVQKSSFLNSTGGSNSTEVMLPPMSDLNQNFAQINQMMIPYLYPVNYNSIYAAYVAQSLSFGLMNGGLGQLNTVQKNDNLIKILMLMNGLQGQSL